MKKQLLLLLCIASLLWGCQTDQRTLENPVTFYYPRTEYVFGQPDSVIAYESREASGRRTELSVLLNEYLQGPTSADLRSPFPAGTKINEIKRDSDVLQLMMNDHFAEATDMELTVACACLTKTCLSLTDCTTVQIIMDGETPDTPRVIAMDAMSLLLMDDIITTTPTKTQEGL